MNVSGEGVPPPIESFETSGLRPHLLENVVKSGYKKPTPIQKHAIPIIMNGRDLMGCAQTGSGKTVRKNVLLVFLYIRKTSFLQHKQIYNFLVITKLVSWC